LAFDWSAFAGALLGAGAALGGVALTQRSERSKAQADRVWKTRSEIYLVIYRWANLERGRMASIRLSGHEPERWETRLRAEEHKDIHRPSEKELALLDIYGSKAVSEAYQAALRAILQVEAAGAADRIEAGQSGNSLSINNASENTKAKASLASISLRKVLDSILAETRP
jgi:hypothetical protein